MKKVLLVLFVFILIIKYVDAQETSGFYDSAYKRNIIKWNITPFIIWGHKNLNFEYERALTPFRSFSVNLGYFVLPNSGIFDSLNISYDKKSYGFTVSGDYRFYIKNTNKIPAPGGLYWGIYASFHNYNFQNDIYVVNNNNVSGTLKWSGGLNILSTGLEFGYQLPFKKRWTVDIVFLAPSVSLYNINMKLSGDLDYDEENEYYQALIDIFTSLIPGFDDLISDGWSTDKGVRTSFGLGFRYLVQIGYRF